MTTMLGTEWHVEPEDRSVGIFGDAIYHEACPLDEATEASDEIFQRDVFTNEEMSRTTYFHRVTCACGATAVYTETDIEPIEEI